MDSLIGNITLLLFILAIAPQFSVQPLFFKQTGHQAVWACCCILLNRNGLISVPGAIVAIAFGPAFLALPLFEDGSI